MKEMECILELKNEILLLSNSVKDCFTQINLIRSDLKSINSKLQRLSILPICGTPNVSPATMVIQLRVIAPIASDAWEKQRGEMGFVDVAIQVLVV